MKRHVIHYSLFVISLCATAHGQIAQRWIAEASRPATHDVAIYRGETIALEPTITVHGRPHVWPAETEVTLWWQSSNMGASWWSTPAALGAATGTLRAVWSPECDSGADRYTFFIRASAPDGIAYRASGTITMRHSPGATPNALPLPVTTLDFSGLEIRNAPWLYESAWRSGSNAFANAVQALCARADAADAHAARRDNPHAVTPEQIGALTQAQLADALAALEFTTLASRDGRWLFTIDGGTGRVWNVYPTNLVYYAVSQPFGYMRPDGTIVEFSGARAAPLSTFSLQDANFTYYQDGQFFVVTYTAQSIPTHMNLGLPPDYPWTVPHAYYNPDSSQSGAGSLTIEPRDVMVTNLVAAYDLSMIATAPDLAAATNVLAATIASHVDEAKYLHRDSGTNLIWKSVFSNGWHWLVAHTNTQAGGGE
ncbi:MAG TPA: hypothetical protein PKZ08_05610 [Vicinamibacterales bacterium]|nr:hypothetical protein [Vicinamibacterales bacterium]